MPIVEGTNLTLRKANVAMASAFFPRAKEWLWPKVCGSYITTSLDEQHAIGGAAPPLQLYTGTLNSKGIPSWTLNIPNLLYKNLLETRREELEGDQTRSIIRFGDQMGVQLADFPDQLLARRILSGSTTASATESFRGKSYSVTMDGLPQFSSVHQLDGVTNQSNIITGSLPTTFAAVAGQDLAVSANQMQQDLMKVVQKLKTVKDNNGLPIFPTIDVKKNIVIAVPPELEVVASLAFRTAGFIGGSNGSSTGSTTSIGPMYVKDVFSTGYLSGIPDPESPGSTISPTYATNYYIFVVNDYVRPFYVQLFKPVGNNDLFPAGYKIDQVIDDAIKAGKAIGIDHVQTAATLFASTVVETNIGAVGSNAQQSVVYDEKFFFSARWRGNLVYGPWFTCWKIDPTGTSN